MKETSHRAAARQIPAHQLMKVALGEAEADLAIVNGEIVNVYTGELLTGDTVLIKGDKIAYVGKSTSQSIGPDTQIIDALGKILIPGLIDGHTHITENTHSASELIRYAMTSGTTTIITEVNAIAFPLGYRGIIEFLKSLRNQPIKFFITLPPMVAISPVAKEHALTVSDFRKLLREKEVVGLGEPSWAPVLEGDERILDFIAETIQAGKIVDGHTAGARDNKLQAYIATGISSCHEPITAEEVLERLRLGLFVLIREGEIRSELESIARIKDENIDLRRLILSTDGLGPRQYVTDGYMDFVVQKAIELGFNPIPAIQMATINVAQRFALDDFVGGIAPGKYADIVIIPDLTIIQPEYVISNGQVVAKNGQLLVEPREHTYPAAMQKTIHLNKRFEASDFAVPADSGRGRVRVRVIDQTTKLLTQEAIIELPVSDGLVPMDTGKDILKVAAIERTYVPGKHFVGFIRGMGLKHGAVANSIAWDTSNIIVVGASESDMAQAVNRLKELNGGIVVSAGGQILAELSLPIGGIISQQPMGILARKLQNIQEAAHNLGCSSPDIRLTLSVLTTAAIPFLRICEAGLVDVRQNRFINLIVD